MNWWHNKGILLVISASLSTLILSACGSNQDQVKAIDVFVSDCGYGYSQKPSSIVLTCGDGDMYINVTKYNSWNSDSAEGDGYFFSNDCNPSCVSGNLSNTPINFFLDSRKKDTNGKYIFSQILISSNTIFINGSKSASFDIGVEPEFLLEATTEPKSRKIPLDVDSAKNDLLARLNAESDLWSLNEVATSDAGRSSHQRLGLYDQPDYVIECNINWSGTWLFLYSSEDLAYNAFNSEYFFRGSPYSAELRIDDSTGMYVILHTSMGGNQSCLDSANSQLSYVATD